MRKLTLGLAGLCIVVLVSGGCGGTSSGSRKGGRASLTIVWPGRARFIPILANSIKAKFSRGDEVIATQILARPASGNQTTATFDNLKVGDLTLTATAYPNSNGTGVAQALGSAPVTVIDGQTATATVTMDSTIDHVDIAPAAISLPIAGTTTAIPTARDASGSIVLISASKGQWSTDSSSTATVSSTGVISGITSGSTIVRYTDTESGKSGSAPVTIRTAGEIWFADADKITTPPLSDLIAAGDMDGDGKPDIIFGSGNGVYILYGRGNGTFDPYVQVASTAGGMSVRTVADMNGDGRPDIICFRGYQNLLIVPNLGGRTFGSIVQVASYPNAMTGVSVGDVNHDGRMDIAVAYSGDYSHGSADIYLNDGGLSFHQQSSTSHVGIVEGIGLGDLNGDGNPDMIVAFETSTVGQSGVTIYNGNGTGNFGVSQDLQFGTWNMNCPLLTDLTGDGKADALVGYYTSGKLAMWINDGTGHVGGTSYFDASQYPINIQVADFNGDGKKDIVVANAGSSHVTVLRNLGGGNFGPGVSFEVVGGNCRGVAVADFNLDGKPDIVAESETAEFVALLINKS